MHIFLPVAHTASGEKMMKKLCFRAAAAILAAVLLYPSSAAAISADKAILVDAQTGRILYQRRIDERSLIASTTKIMTGLIVCQQCNVLDRLQIPQEAVGVEGSSMYLQAGEVLTVQELLYGLMLSSGNDAAMALAIYCGGTVEGFAQLMNDKARFLGLKNTHFVNPHGLDAPDHYSTARDLAILAAYAMQDPIFAQTVSTKTVRVGQRTLQNHNKLLWTVEGADGVKTGYTRAAGRILVSSAKCQGRRLICVTIDDREDWVDHKRLLEDGFSCYHLMNLVEKGQILGYRAVFGGQQSRVPLVAAEDFSYPLAQHEQVSIRIEPGEFVYAPVVRGAQGPFAYVCIDGAPVGKIPLFFGDTVEQQRTEKKGLLKRLFGG